MQHAIRTTLRCTAMVLSFTLLFDQFAHAATPSHKLAALQAAQQQKAQQPQPPAPVERQNPDTTSTTPPPNAEAIARQRLLSAHTLYLARSTQDARFPASPDDAYNLVLNNLKNWGHYQIVDNIALLAETTGVFGETAPAVTLGALRSAVERGELGEDDRVVLLVTGDGLKTPGLVADRYDPIRVQADADQILETLGVQV